MKNSGQSIPIAGAPIGIALLRGSGEIVKANEMVVSLCGYDPAGQAFSSLIGASERAQALAALDGGKPAEIHIGVNAVRLYASPAPEGGRILYFVDITEQKTLETHSAQVQKMQAVGQLAGGLAHDFNNLLTAITGACDLMEESAGQQTPAEVSEIRRNAGRGANLIRHLLAFSRRQALSPKVLDLRQVAEDMCDLFARLLGENIALDLQNASKLWPVLADQTQFQQVLLNLAVNARDAMGSKGGHLTIRTANISRAQCRKLGHVLMPVNEYVVCEVRDTGPGIAAEVAGSIFEPFFSTRKNGSGLGLSTVYGIVKQSGGFIFPANDSKKGGAIFSIYLPRHRGEAGARSPVRRLPSHPAGEAKTGGTIMLVEDDNAVRAFAVRALESRGYQVLEAAGGKEALAAGQKYKASGQTLHAVVSDVIMPDMDGPELVRRLRLSWPDMPVLFISGYAEDAFRDSPVRKGNNFFLPKPFSLAQLVDGVARLMQRNTT